MNGSGQDVLSTAVPLFSFPPAARVDSPLNKEHFYLGARSTLALKELFTDQVRKVTWQYKLGPTTINAVATPDVAEIEVIRVEVSTPQLDSRVLSAIDRTIPNATIHEIVCGDRVYLTAAFKRRSDADHSSRVVEHYLRTDWVQIDAPHRPLPVAINLGILSATVLRTMIDIPPRDGEDLRQHVQRHALVLQHRREAERVEQRMQREKQFNRKVELNDELRAIRERIQVLCS